MKFPAMPGQALRRHAPGVALAAAIALAATLAEPLARALTAGRWPLPPMVIALVMGVILNPVAARTAFQPGLTWCVKKLLRYAIALLGLKVAIADIIALGAGMALLVVGAMVLTVAASLGMARLLKLQAGYGALAGAANAVCGASATLATASVVPNYPAKSVDVVFTVVAANAMATIVMLAYPVLSAALGLSPRAEGILLGATIHDMAQVVGAGYAVSDEVGNTAVIVKLFRVFLLLPMVLAIGAWLARGNGGQAQAAVPMPVFAIVFLLLAVLNSLMPAAPGLMPAYAGIKATLLLLCDWGMLLAIAALGLGTSIFAILAVGWRHLVVFLGGTIVILAITLGGLALSG